MKAKVPESLYSVYGVKPPFSVYTISWYDRRYGLPPNDDIWIAYIGRKANDKNSAVLQSEWRGTEEEALKNLRKKIQKIKEGAKRGGLW